MAKSNDPKREQLTVDYSNLAMLDRLPQSQLILGPDLRDIVLAAVSVIQFTPAGTMGVIT